MRLILACGRAASGQTTHQVMCNDDNWDRFSSINMSIMLAERLRTSYR